MIKNRDKKEKLFSQGEFKGEYSVGRFNSMTGEKKLELSLQLYYSARELKQNWLKQQHPDWNDELTKAELRRIFLYART